MIDDIFDRARKLRIEADRTGDPATYDRAADAFETACAPTNAIACRLKAQARRQYASDKLQTALADYRARVTVALETGEVYFGDTDPAVAIYNNRWRQERPASADTTHDNAAPRNGAQNGAGEAHRGRP